MIFYSIELFITAITYPSFDYCLVSYNESFLLSFFLSKWCNAKLILDYSSLKWSQNDDKFRFLRKIEERILSLADFHICSTKAIQLVLKVRNINSFIIHDPTLSFLYDQSHPNAHLQLQAKRAEGNPNNVDNLYKKPQFEEENDTDKITEHSLLNNFDESRKEAFQILGISQIKSNDTKIVLCGVPLPFYESSIISNLLTIGDKLSINRSSFYIILFTSEKDEKTIKKSIENHHFTSKSTLSRFKVISLHSDCYSFILRRCDFAILFYPTIFGLEYSPQLSDAIQFELPILAFKHGPVCEAVREGQNGFIFSDKIELANLLNKILNEKSIDLVKLRSFYKSPKFDQKWEIEWKKCFDSIMNNRNK